MIINGNSYTVNVRSADERVEWLQDREDLAEARLQSYI